VLLAFRGSKTIIEDGRLLSEIRSVVADDMGDEFQPDKIELFPLYPRFLPDMQVDHAWCRTQYLNGSLFRRKKVDFFRNMTRLRECIMAMEDAKGGR
jgi:hypothetical protein